MKYILLMVLLSWCTGVWSAPSSMKTYTMYTEQQSWNAANMICTLRGGYLVKIESSSENSFLLEQLNGSWDNSVDSFYIGLHNAALKNTAEYFWTDCTPLGPYDNLQISSKEFVMYCVSLLKGVLSNGWKIKTCTDLDAFVCETDGGPCDYYIFNNSTGTKGISYNATVMAQNECLFLCNEAMLNGMECWGVTYNFLTEICILHLSNDSTIFDNGGITSSIGSKFYQKYCLHVDVNNTVYPSILPTNIPYTNCISVPSTGSIYTIFERGVTWQEAKDVCSHIGASLLEYRSHEELTDVLNIAAPSIGGISTFWIGLKRYTNLTFLWQDGTDTATWNNWESFTSNTLGTCVRAVPNLVWLDDNCTNNHSFICEQPGVCGYDELSGMKGNVGTQIYQSHSQCNEICDSDSTCIAYSFVIYICTTHHQSDKYYYFDTSNYQIKNYYSLYRYSCSHALLIGNMSVQIPNLYFPSGINLTASVWTSSSTLETLLIQNATSSVSELSEMSLETFSFTGSIEATESFTETLLIQNATSNFSAFSEVSLETFVFTESIEATESFTETEFSTGVFPDETNTPALETTQFSDSTFQYTETIEQFTETLGYSTDSLDYLDPSSFDYTDSAIQSSTLSETTTPLIGDISFSKFVTADTSYLQLITTIGISSNLKSVIGKTIEPSFTSVINGYGEKSLLEANTSPQTATPSAFPTLYPPKQSKYIPVCPCRCVSRVISSENIEDLIQELVKDLTLDTKNLSRTLHSLYSMEDDRPSAQTIGYSSIILLFCLFSFFFIMDITHFIIHRLSV